jgi:hypothetical protein
MKYTNKKDQIRFFQFNDKWVLVLRKKGSQARYYINGLYMWTKAFGKGGSRLYQKDLGLKPNKEYSDWADFQYAPDHIPNGQQWNFYFLKWKKDNEKLIYEKAAKQHFEEFYSDGIGRKDY